MFAPSERALADLLTRLGGLEAVVDKMGKQNLIKVSTGNKPNLIKVTTCNPGQVRAPCENIAWEG